MSIRCMTNVWEHSEQKGSRLLLLLAIADHADDAGFAWPGIPKLAEKIRMSERHTKRLLQELEAAHELYVDRRDYNNRYIVLVGLDDDGLLTVLMTRLGHRQSEAQGIIERLQTPPEYAKSAADGAEHSDKLSPSEDSDTGARAKHSDIPAQHGDARAEHGDTDVTLTIITPKEPSKKPLGDDDARARAEKPLDEPKTDPPDDDPVLAEVTSLWESEIGGTMSPLLADELLELTEQERDISRWRQVFKASLGKYDRWAWIKAVITSSRGGAKRPSRRKPSKKPKDDPLEWDGQDQGTVEVDLESWGVPSG